MRAVRAAASSPTLTSGCVPRTDRRHAARTSAAVAVTSTPSTALASSGRTGPAWQALRMSLPASGMPADAVLEQLAALRADDRDWRSGRVFSLVYSAGNEVHHLLEEASRLYLSENALNTEVFPSLRRMQADILSITGDLL